MQDGQALRSVVLPSRWGRRQRLKNTLLFFVIRAAITFFQAIPLSLSRWLGALIGRLGYWVARSDRRRAVAQLAQSMPDLEPRFHRRIAHEMFEHLGITAAEVLHMDELVDGRRAVRMSDEQRKVWDDALAEGHGVVAVGGHIGNWELLPQVIARAGYKLNAIAKPLYDPRLTALMHEARARHGMKVLWRGEQSVSKDMLRVFKNKEILALLIDQDTRVQGDFVPFFSRPAFTPTAAATLALRFSAPVVLAWCHRYPDGFELHFERHPFTPSGDRDRDVVELTAQLTAKLEKAIRKVPAQWVWLHKRWKTRPPAG